MLSAINFKIRWLEMIMFAALQSSDQSSAAALLLISVADPGSGTRCLFDPWTRIRDPEYVFFRIPDLRSRIPDPKPIF
jgi:hypothetical protein